MHGLAYRRERQARSFGRRQSVVQPETAEWRLPQLDFIHLNAFTAKLNEVNFEGLECKEL
jgi:hypothetical protein